MCSSEFSLLFVHIYSPSESASESDEQTLEPQLDPGVELPPEIAEASKPSWLYRSSKSPPNRGRSPSASRKSLTSRREAESGENRQKSPSPVQPRIRVSKDLGCYLHMLSYLAVALIDAKYGVH